MHLICFDCLYSLPFRLKSLSGPASWSGGGLEMPKVHRHSNAMMPDGDEKDSDVRMWSPDTDRAELRNLGAKNQQTCRHNEEG
eukprot:g26067.t1